MTVGALLKKLQKLVDQGHSRAHIGVGRDTFEELDNDSVNCMNAINIELVDVEIVDDDGLDRVRKDGSVVTRKTAVIIGSLKPEWRE
ncbi:MAG: hypothetical protein EBW87_01070 [Burkholderiaceae bacterium]|nr:hypothetical protein [Burkholderiaceae bacterium]